MESKVRVYGKAQNRTALGILHAYMKIHPEATVEELRQAFPDSLNPDSGVKRLFIWREEKGAKGNWDGYFKGDDEVLTARYGTQVSLVKMWTKPSLARLIEHAKQYGIEVAEAAPADGTFQKGGFTLEYLNGWTPPVPKQKKGIPMWVWIVLVVIAIVAVVALL